MKKTFILFFVTILVLSTFAFSEVKIGVVNAQDIIQKSKRGMEVTKRLDDFQNKKQQEMNAMQEEIKKLEKDLSNPALNSETRDKKTIEMDAKQKNLKRYVEDARNEWEQETQRELANLEKELMPLIENIGKTKGFTIIFDLSRPGIIYFDQATDITDEVIKAVDVKYPGKPAGATGTK